MPSRASIRRWMMAHKEEYRLQVPFRLASRSGSLYELSGDPDPDYVAYLQGIGRALDLEDPIKGL